jgi:predicted esterase
MALCKPSQVVDKPSKLIVLGPGEGHAHSATVIMLHGFGDTAAGWYSPAMYWAQRLPHVRFILPTAKVDASMGGVPSWFPFAGDNVKEGFLRAAVGLKEVVDHEAEVLAASGGAQRVVVAGFSQGGALAYYLGLQRGGAGEERLGGVLALSTFLRKVSQDGVPADAYVPGEGVVTVTSMDTPVWIAHGTADDRIPGGAKGAARAQQTLEEEGMGDVTLKIYEGMGHEASQRELDDALVFLKRVLPPLGSVSGRSAL